MTSLLKEPHAALAVSDIGEIRGYHENPSEWEAQIDVARKEALDTLTQDDAERKNVQRDRTGITGFVINRALDLKGFGIRHPDAAKHAVTLTAKACFIASGQSEGALFVTVAENADKGIEMIGKGLNKYEEYRYKHYWDKELPQAQAELANEAARNAGWREVTIENGDVAEEIAPPVFQQSHPGDLGPVGVSNSDGVTLSDPQPTEQEIKPKQERDVEAARSVSEERDLEEARTPELEDPEYDPDDDLGWGY